jgi:hypothetical protein
MEFAGHGCQQYMARGSPRMANTLLVSTMNGHRWQNMMESTAKKIVGGQRNQAPP